MMPFITTDCPGWDSRMIAQCVLVHGQESEEDTSLWSDDHVFDFLAVNEIGVVEERGRSVWSYTLHIYQGSQYLVDLRESY